MKIPYKVKRKTLKLLRLLRRQKKQILIAGSLGLLLTLFLTQTHLTINQTPSLSYRAFICVNGLNLQRGDFVSIRDHLTVYFENLHYTKRLVGLPGDRISIKDHQLYVEDNLVGPLQKTTKDGNFLHPNKVTVVPQGHVFVSADHPRSFDSRYQEFGLVREEHLSGRCFGLWPLPVISNQSSVIRRVSLPEKQSIKGEK